MLNITTGTNGCKSMRYEVIKEPGFCALALFDIPNKRSSEVCTHLMIADERRCNEVIDLMLDGTHPKNIEGWTDDPQDELLKIKEMQK